MTRSALPRAVGIAAAVALLTAAPARAQLHPSLCADCHVANQGKPNPLHLLEWENSPHERAGIGCEKCHGGDPNTTDPFFAHRAIVRGHGPETPVHPSSLPRTCGICHWEPSAQFQKSRHAELLVEKHYNGPTCSTCHGYAAAYTLSPRSLEQQCNACHGAGKDAARPGRAADARDWLQQVRDVRKLLDSAQTVIKRTRDPEQRASLEHDYQQAQAPLSDAVHDGHAFVFTNARERLGLAHTRAAALLERLSNVPGRPTEKEQP